MNSLLRIYLVLIFTSSAFNAGSENDSINTGFPVEGLNFAKVNHPQNLQGMADCLTTGDVKEYRKISEATAEISSSSLN
ncbi:hypothetical protein LV84_00300 [Algoriphagus ratkowskyi]|uniref:Uncharacterized protein n=1 Tax=Algoriphagus ratkowskyi TaxID=57028 RepID=A0A2W7TDD6_9BACT|nr:hypothetical protein [Algoriphagus ratkowskyi]PZX61312.1 hypothetical protein LV84_00300 [Algoriphagus ratkowskyi]TXD79420.1 hypothetical protein ESW18_04110 [Algoriphagus ratkowskyi]